MSESDVSLPSDIEEAAGNAVAALIPERSRQLYETAFKRYQDWCTGKKIKDITNQKVLLAYFEELGKHKKSSSLWTYYSMIRSMLLIERNFDISKNTHLIAFLKRKNEGYRPKKSKIFKKQDVENFLLQADDDKFLMIKVALIIGLSGACRREELRSLLFENVKDQGNVFYVLIPDTKTRICREFYITPGNIEGVNMVELVRKYAALRPKHTVHPRFFVSYRNKKCSIQPVGIHTIGNMPKIIANFLKLDNAEQYTGHCFRRSSASLLADSGADITTVKRHGGWRSNTVAEGYIETSSENKKKISAAIVGEFQQNVQQIQSNQKNLIVSSQIPGLNLNKCKNCTINIYK